MSWWKVCKRCWSDRRQTSLTQAYTNLFPDTTVDSFLAVTTLRCRWSMYVLFVQNNFFLIACFAKQLTGSYFPNSPRISQKYLSPKSLHFKDTGQDSDGYLRVHTSLSFIIPK
jgi:hypothetical protein